MTSNSVSLYYKFQIPRKNNPTGPVGISQSTPGAFNQGQKQIHNLNIATGSLVCGLRLLTEKAQSLCCVTPPECICPIGDVIIKENGKGKLCSQQLPVPEQKQEKTSSS